MGFLHLDMQIAVIGVPGCVPVGKTCNDGAWIFRQWMAVKSPEAAIDDLDIVSPSLATLNGVMYAK